MTTPNISRATQLLQEAITLHEKHMTGEEPTTGPKGMDSQMKMMRLMEEALRALKGGNRLTDGILSSRMRGM